MCVYAIAQLTITDRESYSRYQEKFMEVFQKFQGRLLAADEMPLLVEGSWQGDKIVLMSFPDKDAFDDWADSPEYKEISKDRLSGAETIVLLINGIP